MNPTSTPSAGRPAPAGYPEEWPELISEAERRGYLSFPGERVRYHCADPTDHVFSDPEERVRAAVFSWLVIAREYPPEAIKVEVRVPRRTPGDYADLVVYTDRSCRTPYLVVETKAPRRPEAAFQQAVEQVFGNANSLRDTAIALVDAGDRHRLHADGHGFARGRLRAVLRLRVPRRIRTVLHQAGDLPVRLRVSGAHRAGQDSRSDLRQRRIPSGGADPGLAIHRRRVRRPAAGTATKARLHLAEPVRHRDTRVARPDLPDQPDAPQGRPHQRCPAFRRFLFRSVQILAIVSLPDHAFRRSGAQNKTSVLFVRRWSDDRRSDLERLLAEHADSGNDQDQDGVKNLERALGLALKEHDYPVFLAEAEQIGYTATGVSTELNDLYSGMGFDVDDASDTILGQYRLFLSNPENYCTCVRPACTSLMASDLYAQHASHRIDSKYFTFKSTEEIGRHRAGRDHRLGGLLARRRQTIVPSDFPETEFKTITLTLQGDIKPREAGKGRNPPGWHGSYFRIGQRWFVARQGDIVASRIDLWKGCIGVIPREFDGAIVTAEFPVYRIRPERTDTVDGRYLQMLLRSSYFRRALRAVTTGHSNRRRTQEADFFDLAVPLPDLSVQVEIADQIAAVKRRRDRADDDLGRHMRALDRAIAGDISLDALRAMVESD